MQFNANKPITAAGGAGSDVDEAVVLPLIIDDLLLFELSLFEAAANDKVLVKASPWKLTKHTCLCCSTSFAL